MSFYAVLGVSESAAVQAIKSAHRRLSLQYHPDKNRNAEEDERRRRSDLFCEISNALEILGDEHLRRLYDRLLASLRLANLKSSDKHPDHRHFNWHSFHQRMHKKASSSAPNSTSSSRPSGFAREREDEERNADAQAQAQAQEAERVAKEAAAKKLAEDIAAAAKKRAADRARKPTHNDHQFHCHVCTGGLFNLASFQAKNTGDRLLSGELQLRGTFLTSLGAIKRTPNICNGLFLSMQEQIGFRVDSPYTRSIVAIALQRNKQYTAPFLLHPLDNEAHCLDDMEKKMLTYLTGQVFNPARDQVFVLLFEEATTTTQQPPQQQQPSAQPRGAARAGASPPADAVPIVIGIGGVKYDGEYFVDTKRNNASTNITQFSSVIHLPLPCTIKSARGAVIEYASQRNINYNPLEFTILLVRGNFKNLSAKPNTVLNRNCCAELPPDGTVLTPTAGGEPYTFALLDVHMPDAAIRLAGGSRVTANLERNRVAEGLRWQVLVAHKTGQVCEFMSHIQAKDTSEVVYGASLLAFFMQAANKLESNVTTERVKELVRHWPASDLPSNFRARTTAGVNQARKKQRTELGTNDTTGTTDSTDTNDEAEGPHTPPRTHADPLDAVLTRLRALPVQHGVPNMRLRARDLQATAFTCPLEHFRAASNQLQNRVDLQVQVPLRWIPKEEWLHFARAAKDPQFLVLNAPEVIAATGTKELKLNIQKFAIEEDATPEEEYEEQITPPDEYASAV